MKRKKYLSPRIKFKKSTFFFIGFFVLLILIHLILLIIQNRKLNSQIIFLKKEVPHLLKGDYAPPIAVIGKRKSFNFNSKNKKSLLFVFTTFCIHCDKNLTFWKRLSYELKPKTQIIAIVTKGMEQSQNLKVNFPIYVPEDINRFMNDYRVSDYSQTILINREGEIEWIKAGKLNSDDYFKIKELVQN